MTAAAVRVARVSAGRYLEHLASTGSVSTGLRNGEVGRPERGCTWLR